MPKPADGGTLSGSEASCAAVPVDVEGKQRSAVTAWRPSCAATSGHCGQTDVLNDSSRLFQRLARDGAHQADGEGRRVELGRGDRAAHRRCGVGTECAHDRVHDADCGARSDQARVSITGLTGVGEKAATIPWFEFTLTTSAIYKPGRADVTVQAETSKFPAGLYEGSLVTGTSGKQAPALFYVRHAQLAGD